MNILRNFLAVPVAAILGIYIPGAYIYLAYYIESGYCWLESWLPLFMTGGASCALDGYIFFIFPSALFWLFTQTILAGSLAGFTIIYVAIKVASEEDKLLYFSLFATSLLITLVAVYGNLQKDLLPSIATILSNVVTFSIAGLYPLYLMFTNEKLSKGL